MVLGEYHTWKGSGHTRKLVKKTDTMMYVPILKTIAGLLNPFVPDPALKRVKTD